MCVDMEMERRIIYLIIYLNERYERFFVNIEKDYIYLLYIYFKFSIYLDLLLDLLDTLYYVAYE